MNSQERARRIAQLQKELRMLQEEEAEELKAHTADVTVRIEAMKERCRELLREGKGMAAIKHYRNAVGCTLFEAKAAIEAL